MNKFFHSFFGQLQYELCNGSHQAHAPVPEIMDNTLYEKLLKYEYFSVIACEFSFWIYIDGVKYKFDKRGIYSITMKNGDEYDKKMKLSYRTYYLMMKRWDYEFKKKSVEDGLNLWDKINK